MGNRRESYFFRSANCVRRSAFGVRRSELPARPELELGGPRKSELELAQTTFDHGNRSYGMTRTPSSGGGIKSAKPMPPRFPAEPENELRQSPG